MKPVRLNTLVVDTSVFAKRPSTAEIKEFFDSKLQLDMTNVKRIQLHNIKNVVYLGMRDMAVANRIAADHHLKHYMRIGGKEIPILVPVYVESSATDVRLHDLPEEIDTKTIVEHLSQYGEVISIRDELWKNFWPGFSNGVTVVRMRLTHHIPSYLNFEDFEESSTLVTYRSQIRTCARCNRKAHPKQRCSEAAAAEKSNSFPAGSSTTAAPRTNNNTQSNNAEVAMNQSFPALPTPPAVAATTVHADNAQKQFQSTTKTTRVKRQHTIEAETANKKPSGSDDRPLLVDQQAIYDEYERTNAFPHLIDPASRKEKLWYFAGRDVELNKIKLAEAQRKN